MRMFKGFKNRFAFSLACPKDDWFGWFANNYMKRRNTYLELAAVKLSKIEPHHRVLEVGFGPGVGLEATYHIIKDGIGKLYGVDISSYMVNKARKKFERAISEGKMELHRANVINLPFLDDKFDCVFHCNCFYFWPDLIVCAKELHRVMRPGSHMVTTLNLKSVQDAKKRKLLLPKTNIDPLNYLVALENSGFQGVHIEYLKYGNETYQAIFATAVKKESLNKNINHI